jgi:two-component system cell cycle sensor histidine kinase/response regulator CckA
VKLRADLAELFDNFADHPDPHLLLSGEGLVLAANTAFLRANSVTNSVVEGRSCADFVAISGLTEHLQSVNAGITRRLSSTDTNSTAGLEVTLTPLRLNGVVSATLMATRPADGTTAVSLRPAVITAQQEVIEFHEQLRLFETMFHNYSAPFVIRTIDNVVERWNKASADLYGWPGSEVVGKNLASVLQPEPHQFATAMAILLADGAWSGEIEYRARDGHSVFFDARWTLMRDSDGEPYRIFSTGFDVTTNKAERDQRERNSRFESLGTLAGGIAHDLNNALTPILLSSQLLLHTEQNDKNLRLLRSIESSAIHGANLIKRVLQFAGVKSKNYVLDAGTLIRNVAAAVRENLPAGHSIQLEVQDRLLPVLADTTQLRQVVVNLLSNAQQAMPQGGHILLRAFGESAEHDGEDRATVVIEVEDSGTGITNDDIDRIFDPFFTTKAVGDGTGLGLSTSLTIVKNLRGTIRVRNNVEVGATFTVTLPAATGTSSQSLQTTDSLSNASSLTGSSGVGRLVLVVDDDEEVREITCSLLREHGYQTVSAHDEQRAISYIESGEPLDLVLTDITMPRVDGIAFGRYVQSTRPDVGIVTMSGRYRPIEAAPSLAGVSHLIKPFSTEQLLNSVSAALNPGTPHAG